MHPLVLAQSGSSVVSMWIWIVILIGVVLVGAGVIFKVRRSLFENEDSSASENMGLMGQLDKMRKTGEISEDEYRQARTSLLDRSGLMGDEQDQEQH